MHPFESGLKKIFTPGLFRASSLSNSFKFPRYTTYDPVIIIFSFNMSKPTRPTLFDHQTDCAKALQANLLNFTNSLIEKQTLDETTAYIPEPKRSSAAVRNWLLNSSKLPKVSSISCNSRPTGRRCVPFGLGDITDQYIAWLTKLQQQRHTKSTTLL